jgi:hypothetical protein
MSATNQNSNPFESDTDSWDGAAGAKLTGELPMLRTAVNSLNISKSQTKDRLKEIAHALIKKTPSPNRSQIIQELQELGFSELESNQALRSLEDNHEIFVIEDSGFLKVSLNRDISPYEREISRFQESWLKARDQEDCSF